MPWVPDSTTYGYLGPIPGGPAPLQDDSWDDFLQAVLTGVSGYDPTMVRPRWQVVPANIPAFGTDWMTFGIATTTPDWDPVIVHYDDPTGGYDLLQDQETAELACIFYGPNCEGYASVLRRGLFLDQNRAVFRANSVALVECGPFTHAPELVKQQWLPRVDMTITLRRAVRYHYNVKTILRAQGTITANRPGDDPTTVDTTFDTADAGTVWDQGQTVWDGAATQWD